MGYPERIVFLKSLADDTSLGDYMRFRLTYEGPLQARQKDPPEQRPDKMAPHIHGIRQQFHGQLKRLWETHRFLKDLKVLRSAEDKKGRLLDGAAQWGAADSEKTSLQDYVASLYQINGYRFAPLVRENLELSCDLNVLFLRMDHPGSVIDAGDLDNRLKTLIDALKMPKAASAMVGNEVPKAGEDPFFVLLEDDRCVTGFSVESDTLLEPPSGSDQRTVKLIVSVNIRPYIATNLNFGFA